MPYRHPPMHQHLILLGHRLHAPLSALLIVLSIILLLPGTSSAAAADDIQGQIDQHNQQIAALDAEIAQYQKELDAVSTQKQTLQGTLDSLDISRKKIQASISLAQNQISATNLEIGQLETSIGSKQASIEDGTGGLAESIRLLNQTDSESLAMLVLNADSLSTLWDDTNTVAQFQASLQDQIKALAAAKADLETAKSASEQKQAELIAQKNDLSAQEQALDVNRQQQAQLLAETQDKESNYQALIEQKKAAEAQFESELTDLESQLSYTLNPASIPPAGTPVLSWPLKSITITQYFGDTSFSKTGAYDGKGHNGVDLAATIGTPVYAALDGIILGAGDTDGQGCYSFGKWIMIKHPDGLSTLYGHLSKIGVTVGQKVTTGQLIGYSGFTGYATGPHLHFGLYVSGAVQIMDIGAWYKSEGLPATTACAKAGISIPVAPLNGYLNPIDYLPAAPKK